MCQKNNKFEFYFFTVSDNFWRKMLIKNDKVNIWNRWWNQIIWALSINTFSTKMNVSRAQSTIWNSFWNNWMEVNWGLRRKLDLSYRLNCLHFKATFLSKFEILESKFQRKPTFTFNQNYYISWSDLNCNKFNVNIFHCCFNHF